MSEDKLLRGFERLSPAKQKLLLARLRRQEEDRAPGGSTAPGAEIPPSPLRATGGPYPLSFAQQRLWFVDRLEPGSPAYNLADAVRMSGRLAAAALERALSEVVRRHEALRTVFEVAAGRPVQRVLPPAPVPLPRVDLAGLPAGRRDAEALQLAREEARVPFDVPRGPHLRARLLRLSGDEHVALFTTHHIVSDAWSMGVLIRELSALYAAAAGDDAGGAGRPAVDLADLAELAGLPALPIQYPDFADWQRRMLAGESLERLLAFWRGALAGAPHVLELPTDRPRPPAHTTRGASRGAVLPAALSARLGALADAAGATPFMVLLAGLAVLLSRHAGQEDLLIGAPVAGRTRLATEGLIGFFVNTLVLRADLSDAAGDLSFEGLLARVRETTLAAYAHADLPFERLVEELQPARDLARPPLYQVALAFQNAPGSDLALPGITLSPLALAAETAQVDLSVEAAETPAGIALDWRFNVDLFDPATALRLAGQLAALLTAVAAEPGRPLAGLPLLGEEERHAVLHGWSGMPASAASEAMSDSGAPDAPGTSGGLRLLHAGFFERAAATPGAPALVAADQGAEPISYGELARRVDRLAHRLVSLGVVPEVRVGICVERSVAMVEAVLAVLRAGGAYVPLDPTYPRERLALMLEDAGAELVLASERGAAALPATAPVVRVEELRPAPGAEGDPGVPIQPENLAYVIFTSGSTGRPKGVAVPHRGAAGVIAETVRLFQLGPGDHFLQFSSLSFDASVVDMLGTLASGACLHLLPGGGPPPAGRELAAELRRGAVDMMVLSPSVLATLDPAEVPQVRTVMVGAEKCSLDLVRRWAPGRRFLNVYGPTEGSVLCTAWEAPSGEVVATPPVGRPIANARVLLLDSAGRPVPVGAAGELHLGGAGLARGYLGRPDLSAERFVPDALADRPGERLYRTGDLARWLPDGNLDLLGRIDAQVKLRGFRVEPGEVEAVLAQHPEVARVAVDARGDTDSRGDRTGWRLVAWVVPASPAGADAGPAADAGDAGLWDRLRAHLRERLPEFMVPSAFAALAELPLTASGKLDRAALPDPAAAGGPAAAWAPPEGAIEAAVAEVWREVLGAERVGREDNFFDLGGHSLLLVDVQSKLRERLGEEVPLLDLFRHPTVGTLVRHLAARAAEAAGTPEPSPALPARPAAVASAVGASRSIAIVGLAGRFPGARDLSELWRNLRDGVESISVFTPEELAAAGVPPELLADPNHVPVGGVLEDADLFDAAFFGIGPREAQILDPQQRLFLECAHEALERAGYGSERRRGRVGIFAGGGTSSYALQNLWSRGGGDAFEVTLGNDKDFLATRAAYKLDLHGPALTVQTACSTSLVAVHLAIGSLLAGECDMALAGGVTVDFPQRSGYVYQEGGIASPDGHNRAFDARAGGTVGGAGVGVVVLKPLAAALADGDTVHAVVRGSAMNNDGASRVGYTAPAEQGQAEVIAAALAAAGVEPRTIQYVEAHGSATPVGDPIEVAALTRAFRAAGPTTPASTALGSIKSNIGHAGSAAGVAGLLKTVLALEHRQIPPSLHFERPNPAIDFAAGPFYVAAELQDWPEGVGELDGGERPAPASRRAGVSSFGLGGTNVHLVVEEAPPPAPAGPSRPWKLVSLSARTPAALEAATDRLVEHLRENPGEDLADVCFTLHVGRKGWEHRRVLLARDREDALEALARRDPRRLLTSSGVPREGAGRPVAFVLSGIGEQYGGLASGLYRDESAFREELDRCADLLAPLVGADVREVLFVGDERQRGGTGPDLRRMLGRRDGDGDGTARHPAPGALDRTELAQPALFALGYALARLWTGWGIAPRALLGYSLGELTAACLAGVLALADAVRLVAERARLVAELPPGAMLAVSLPEEELRALLGDPALGAVAVATVNGPRLTVASGPVEAVAALEARLAESGTASRWLRTAQAFHSPSMAPAASRLAEVARRLDLAPPRIPLLSNVTGTWMTPAEAADPGYWAEHLRRTVRFSDGLGELWREPDRVLLEVGPGGSLAALALQHPAAEGLADPVAVASLPSAYERQPDQAYVLTALGKLWLAGVDVDWEAFYAGERRRRLPLPGYPFERQRFWVEPESGAAVRGPGRAEAPAPVRRPEGPGLARPAWRRVPRPAHALVPGEALAAASPRWLLFARDGDPLAARLAARLGAAGIEAVEVVPGEGFVRRGERSFSVSPGRREDCEELLWALGTPLPGRIVHLWEAGEPAGRGEVQRAPGDEGAPDLGFGALVALVQAIAVRLVPGTPGAPFSLAALVAASGVSRVTAAEPLVPERAPLAALCELLPREVPGARCRLVDVGEPPPAGSWHEEALAEALLADLGEAAAAPEGEVVPAVAYRGGERWVFDLEPITLEMDGRRPAGAQPDADDLWTGDAGTGAARPVGHEIGGVEPGVIGTGDARVMDLGGRGHEGEPASREVGPPAGGAVLLLGSPDGPLGGLATRLVQEGALVALVAPAGGVRGGGAGHPHAMPPSHPEASRGLGTPTVTDSAFAGAPADPAFTSSVDFDDPAALSAALAAAGERLGPPAAAMVDFAPELPDLALALAGRGEWEPQLAAAARRLAVLVAAIEAARPRAVLLLSSFEAIAASPGRALAAAVARLADAQAAEAGRTGPCPWTVVDWDRGAAWIPGEATGLLRRLLARPPAPHLVISTGDPAEKLRAAAAPLPEGVGTPLARHARPALRNAFVPPETETERRLAEIWGTLLGVEPVGLHDSFFDLGGDSLLATQLANRVRDAYGVKVELPAFFERPTPAGLAETIDQAAAAHPSAAADAEEIARLIERLEGLSAEEVDMLLAERGLGGEAGDLGPE